MGLLAATVDIFEDWFDGKMQIEFWCRRLEISAVFVAITFSRRHKHSPVESRSGIVE